MDALPRAQRPPAHVALVPLGVAQPPAAPLQERALLVHRDQCRDGGPAVRHLPRRPVGGADVADRQEAARSGGVPRLTARPATRSAPQTAKSGSHSAAWPSIARSSYPPSGSMTPASTSHATTVLAHPYRTRRTPPSQPSARHSRRPPIRPVSDSTGTTAPAVLAEATAPRPSAVTPASGRPGRPPTDRRCRGASHRQPPSRR